MKPKFFQTPFGPVLGVKDGPAYCGTVLTKSEGSIVPVLTSDGALIQVPIHPDNYHVVQYGHSLYLAYKDEVIQNSFHLPHYVRHANGTLYYSFMGEIRVVTTAIIGALQVKPKQFKAIRNLPINLDNPGNDIPQLLRALNEP